MALGALLLAGHFQSCLPPESVRVASGQVQALFEKGRPGPLVSTAGVFNRIGAQPFGDLGVKLIGWLWRMAPGGAVLADQLAGPSLANLEPAAQLVDAAPAPVRG